MTRKSKQPSKTNGVQSTENKNIDVDKLPEFSRANKYIGEYNVFIRNNEVPDGTTCVIYAHSVKTGSGELKNNVSVVKNGIAKFDDLRFVGKSGRGTRFDVYFKFETKPFLVVSYKHAIKVTVDGPRPPRLPKSEGLNGQMAIKRKSSDSIDLLDNCDFYETRLNKLIKPSNSLDCTHSRRDSYFSSKSPETSSISPSYPCSPQSSYASSESSSMSLPILADTAITSYSNAFYTSVKELVSYQAVDSIPFDIRSTEPKSMPFNLNGLNLGHEELNSEAALKYFWFAVHRYYYMFQQRLVESQSNN